MSSPIEVKGQFRGQILETLHEIKRTQTKAQKLMADLEAIAQNAATCQGVDLKLFVLDVDTLEFTERPLPVPQAINETAKPHLLDGRELAHVDASPVPDDYKQLVGFTELINQNGAVPDATGDSVTTE